MPISLRRGRPRPPVVKQPKGLAFVLGGTLSAAAGLAALLLLTPFDFGFGAPQVRIDATPATVVSASSSSSGVQ